MVAFAHGPESVRLGDLEVRRLGFGAMQLPGPGVWGDPKDPARARRVLERAVELGINYIDTSWYYGPLVANRLIAEALHPYPRGLVIGCKLGGKRTPDKGWASALRPEELRAGCEDDLRTLKRETIDVCHLRWIFGSEVSFREALDAMIALVNEGKIRHIGLSNVTPAQLEDALGRTKVVSVQNLYNVAAGAKKLGAFPHAVVAEQEKVVDACATRGIAFVPFFSLSVPGPKRETPALLSALAERHGATVAQVSLAWLLARSKTMLPIPGTSSPEHVEENWRAHTLALTAEEIASITEARGP